MFNVVPGKEAELKVLPPGSFEVSAEEFEKLIKEGKVVRPSDLN